MWLETFIDRQGEEYYNVAFTTLFPFPFPIDSGLIPDWLLQPKAAVSSNNSCQPILGYSSQFWETKKHRKKEPSRLFDLSLRGNKLQLLHVLPKE